MKVSNTRQSSIELLRILAMLGVLTLHFNNAAIGGGFRFVSEGSANQIYLYITENLAICAVNLFIMISAYFLATTNERRIVKVIELIIELIIFRVFWYMIAVIKNPEVFSAEGLAAKLLPIDYFVILYSVLYIVSPYINLALKKLSKNSFKKLIITFVIIFSIWTIVIDYGELILGPDISALNPVSRFGSGAGYTLVNFVLIYCIGAYISLHKIKLSRKLGGVLGLVISFLALLILSFAEHKLGSNENVTWNYNNPFIILFTVSLFLIFKDMKFQSKVINELAKAAFTGYVFHWGLIEHIGVERAVTDSLPALILHHIVAIILLYLLSYIAYKVYYLCSHWFFKLITPACEKINISVHEEKLEN